MVSQSKSSINIALCLTATLITASTTQAQLSTVPKRHRSKSDYNKSKVFGRKQRQLRGQQLQQQQQQRKKKSLRKLEGDFSMPLQESEFDMSMPSGPSARMMSMSIHESEFDLSMPLHESEFDLSMPIMDGLPTQTVGDEMEDVIALGENVSNSDGNTLILASFLAGISALIVGAAALFVKMRQKHNRQGEESQERQDMQMREVSFASHDDLNDIEGEGREIVIT
eukprot:CAMPEP_0201867602 /NCGR_PEP_ID=MMETSP0902-20130614/1776_1 /ASSEMBLY_ACC=CAM_ASM_000551 /TAXON_ID=420261 /ORGANISM="Thalassiosira antarctica, Strain CCMP982" /LENGTH=224 /DNA_ID=CAMNT_0048392783 /DNA_START=92 /DNA_END=766 /DNA_ORIENTATION=+